MANADLVDNIKVQENLGEYVKEILEQEKESDKGPIKSILLECTQMPHYAAAIRQSTGLPVFDVVTCVNFFASSLCHPLPKAQVLNGVMQKSATMTGNAPQMSSTKGKDR